MTFNGKRQKEFQIKILKDQLKTCWTAFHDKAQKWLEEVKNITENKVSAETKSHPNQIMSDLKRINYQRAYIEFKIQTFLKDKKLPTPHELRRKMTKAELSVEFQKDFPEEFAQFTKQLRNKLRSKPYRPVMKVAKAKKDSTLNVTWRLNLDDKITSPRKKKKPSPSVNTLIRAINGHSKTFRDHNGYFQPPTFTKAKVEKTFSIYMPMKTFHKLKERLNSIEKRKKLGRARFFKNMRKGKNLYES